MVTSATTEKLGIMDWAIDRDVFSFRNTYIPLSVYRPHLAESWDTPDPLTIIFNIRKGCELARQGTDERERVYRR